MPPTISILSPEACRRIDEGALHVLEHLGVHVAHDETCEILKRSGARVDRNGTVRLPLAMVREALSAAPKRIELACSDGRRLHLPVDTTYYCSRVKYPRQQDYPPTRDHVPTCQDIMDNCRLASHLPDVAAVFVLDGPTADLDDDLNWLLTPAMVLSGTPRHVISPPIHLRSARYWAEIAEAASPSGDLRQDPLLTIEVSPHGPLRLDADTAQIELFAARHGIPLLPLPVPIAGVTAPITVAGTLVVAVAEELFMLTLAQAVNPGTPVLYGTNAVTFNMRTGAVSLGDPEAALLGAGELAMAHFYGLPNYRVTGFTDAFYPDVQAGIEKTLSAFMGLASGADLLTMGGALGSSTIISHEQIVIDQDIFQVARRAAQGILVNEETLALDVILGVGHRGGGYLEHDHTIRWLRTPERYFGGDFNRKPGMNESEMMLAQAHRRVRQILAGPADSGVPAAVVERIDRYVRDHGARLPGRG